MAKPNANGARGALQLPFEQPILRLRQQISDWEAEQRESGRDYSRQIRQLRAQYVSLLRQTYQNLTPWETVQVARHPERPQAEDYIQQIISDFIELYGDRRFADDRAIRTGFGQLGKIGAEKVMLLAHQKGRDTKEKIACNFGYAHPEGYRKALRAMKLAEKFRLPVVSLVDTPAAHPGIGAEERGIAESIARNLLEMSRLRTPVVVVVLGEGGSGGALGMGVGDRMAVMEFAFYSVIPPEGCAAILWRAGEKAPEAAEAMKITARDLKDLDVIDDIIPEPLGGAHRDPAEAATNLERYIVRTLRELKSVPIDRLLQARYDRWRRMGKVERVPTKANPQPAKQGQ